VKIENENNMLKNKDILRRGGNVRIFCNRCAIQMFFSPWRKLYVCMGCDLTVSSNQLKPKILNEN